MSLWWKVFLPVSVLSVSLVSGYVMLTRFGAAEDNLDAPMGTTNAGASLSYVCRFANNSTLALVRQVSDNPARVGDEWAARLNAEEFSVASLSEWGISEGGSFALNWTQHDGVNTAYVSFSDIPDQNDIQPMWVEMQQNDGTKIKSRSCTGFAVN